MLSQQYMLTFSACYEFVPGLYEFRLIPLDYIPVSLVVDTCHLSLLVQSCYGHFSYNLKIIATEGFKLQNVSLVSVE